MKRNARIAMGLLAGGMLGFGLTLLKNSHRELESEATSHKDVVLNSPEEIVLGDIIDSVEEPVA